MPTPTTVQTNVDPKITALIRAALFVRNEARDRHQFLSQEGLANLAKVARLYPVLVRCNSCRFTCPAQDARHIIDALEQSGRDYVRDVSAPHGKDLAGDMELTARYIAENQAAILATYSRTGGQVDLTGDAQASGQR